MLLYVSFLLIIIINIFYRLDSDVVLNHGSFKHRLNNKVISDFTTYPVWNNNFYGMYEFLIINFDINV